MFFLNKLLILQYKNFKVKRNLFVLSILIIVAALSRILPHSYNFTPIGAMALLGGAYYGNKILAFAVPLITLYISDFFINNFIFRSFFPDKEGLIFFSDFMIYTYLGTALMVLLGKVLLKKVNFQRLLGGAIGASMIFFLISNFGVWLGSVVYPKSLMGLILCYEAGLPFLSSSLLGNLVFTFVLFTAYEVIVNKKAAKIYSFA